MDEKDYSWLFDDMTNMKEKIKFRDRIEYRVNGELHNPFGPAVIRFKNLYKLADDFEEKEYWIRGVKKTEKEWNIMIRKIKLKRLMKKIKSEPN
jgi:hypothetical protein